LGVSVGNGLGVSVVNGLGFSVTTGKHGLGFPLSVSVPQLNSGKVSNKIILMFFMVYTS
jgi:hypothetical protein